MALQASFHGEESMKIVVWGVRKTQILARYPRWIVVVSNASQHPILSK
jgi:hypothetical protein